MFGRAAVLPVDLILGIPSTSAPQTQLDYSYSKQAVENLQLAYELARRNLKERADKQAVVNETLSFPSFKTGEQVLITAHTTKLTVLTPNLSAPGVDHIPYERNCLLSFIVSLKMATPPRLLSTLAAVSYTHLTLPTICSV